MKRVFIYEPKDDSLGGGQTWIKAKKYDQWFEVVEVKRDSLYVKMHRAALADSVIILPLNDASLERKSHVEPDFWAPFIAGMLTGATVTFIVLVIHLGGGFDSESF
ncbi:MAG: hypothetical protein GWN00_10205 [Aliifodinibius sp.]|nr:hypothetical protein [Fodinibius sp.]NIY25161.1 hypothetical protein [Fodinibius sp.]